MNLVEINDIEINETTITMTSSYKKQERTIHKSELERIQDESYLPSISLYKYKSIFNNYNIMKKLDHIDNSKNQRLINYTQFGLDSNYFFQKEFETISTNSKKYIKDMKSSFENQLDSYFLKMVSGYIASSKGKIIEESVEIYNEYEYIKKFFNNLPEREILESLLFYRDSENIDFIKNKLSIYSKMMDYRNRMDSSERYFFSDSILKNILIYSGEGEDLIEKTESTRKTILDVADIYMNAPAYIIAACVIHSNNPYSAVPHYMSRSSDHMYSEFTD